MSDPVRLWKSQPEEKLEMNLQHFMDRRARELSSKTRLDIFGSVAAAVFFLAVITWRFALVTTPWQYAAIALIIAWIVLSLYWFRERLGKPGVLQADAPASASLDYYRTELTRRRDHLNSAWVWQGPVLLACVFFLATIGASVWPDWRRMLNALPFVLFLVVWITAGVIMRRNQVRQIQQEIDELDQLR